MKIVTVVGARPQFIKAAVVSKKLRTNHTEILVHTGQHYDYNMSERFFEELSIPRPDYNLGISGGTHAEMTGKMMMALEDVLLKEKPDCLLVYGDTNSTLAAALAAAKLHIKICHVESGTRTRSMTNPEEINRICTDHISTLRLASTELSMNNLILENLSHNSFFVGDPMYDAFLNYSNKLRISDVKIESIIDGKVVNIPREYYYLTCHREENTGDDKTLYEILSAMDSLDSCTIYPVHPRNRSRAIEIVKEKGLANIIICQPVGYLESIALVNNACKVVTDSGGLQREAFFAKKKCVTVLEFEVWPETMVDNRNTLAKPIKASILEKIALDQTIEDNYMPFGDGCSAERIVEKLEQQFVRG